MYRKANRKLARYKVPAVVGGAWTPASLTGLLGWYKAGAGVYSDAGTTPAVNNDVVVQWNDQSGNNNHLSNTGGATSPILSTTGFNGRRTLDFTAGGGWLVSGAFAMGGGSAGSCFVAGLIKTGAANVARMVVYSAPAQSGTSANSAIFLITHSGAVAAYQQGFLSETTYVADTNYRMGTVFDGANATQYLNNTGATPGAASFTWTTGGTLSVGAEAAGGTPIDCKISELIVTNATMSSGDRSSLDSYLQTAWGL